MGVFEIRDNNGKIYQKTRNLITTEGQNSIVTFLRDQTAPDWLYVAVGAGTTAPASADTVLVEELCRKAATGIYSPNPGTVRFVAVFTVGEANGDWNELGIFNEAAIRQSLHSCETTTNWSSDGSLSQETSEVQSGAASLQCTMTAAGTIAFQNSNLTYGTVDWGTADYFQFWHYVDSDIGTATVRLGSDASNYYEWSWVPGGTGSWKHFHETLDSASETGTPGTALDYFRMTHGSVGSGFDQYLDELSLFRENGTLYARGTVDATKAFNTVRNVYYSIKVS